MHLLVRQYYQTIRQFLNADLVLVPLKNICSKKCEIPLLLNVSFREPVPIQTPIATERTVGIFSSTILTPF